MPETQPEEIAIGAFAVLIDAWGRGDAHAFAEAFTDDADFVNVYGSYVTGHGAIERLHQEAFDGQFKDSTVTFNPVRARFVHDDVLIAIAETKLKLASENVRGTLQGMVGATILRDGSRWRIASFQNTRVQHA